MLMIQQINTDISYPRGMYRILGKIYKTNNSRNLTTLSKVYVS